MAELSTPLQDSVRTAATAMARALNLQDRITRIGQGLLAIDNTGRPTRVCMTNPPSVLVGDAAAGFEAMRDQAVSAEVLEQMTRNIRERLARGESESSILQMLGNTRRDMGALADVYDANTREVMARVLQQPPGQPPNNLLNAADRLLPEFNFGDLHTRPFTAPPGDLVERLRRRRAELGVSTNVADVQLNTGERQTVAEGSVQHLTPSINA